MLSIAGFVIGFLIGLTGMGGGALTTPFLILWLQMNPILAIGTDLLFAAITKIAGGYQHWREDNVALGPVLWMAAGSLPATFLAAQLVLANSQNQRIIESILPRALGATLIVVALLLLFRLIWRPKIHLTQSGRKPQPAGIIVIGICGGLLVGLTSVGGGTVIMALLVFFYALPVPQMVGLDVMHGALLTSVAALTYAVGQQIDWHTTLWLLVGSLPGVWLGARATNRVNIRIVRFGLALLIFLSGLQLLAGQGWH